MSLSIGIVGLPSAGKSVLFNSLLKRQAAQVGKHPFTTTEPITGVVEVPDKRLDELAKLLGIGESIPEVVKFIDLAGLVRGSHQGQGLGSAFLANVRDVDAILQIVRFFGYIKIPSTGENIVRGVSHVMGSVYPLRDIEVINEELRLAGINKPVIYLINIDQKLIPKPGARGELRDELKLKMRIDNPIFACVKLESEIDKLTENEKEDYLLKLGVNDLCLDRVIKESYKLLTLLTFYVIKSTDVKTSTFASSYAKASAFGSTKSAYGPTQPADKSEGRSQVQAWSLRRGKTILEAAEIINTDSAKNFVGAEIISFEELTACSSWQMAKEEGKIIFEGKDYIVQDGDVVEFRFEV